MALGISAILALVLYMGIAVVIKARDSAVTAVGPVRQAMIASELVRQEMESVLPPTGELAGKFVGIQTSSGVTETDSVSFFCVGSDGAWEDRQFAEGIRMIELGVNPGTDNKPGTLVRRTKRNLLPLVDQDPEEEILCRGVRSFTLRYFDGSNWQETWDSTTVGNVLPLAVQMTLEIDTGVKDAKPYRVVKTMPLACGKLATDTSGTSGTGGTP